MALDGGAGGPTSISDVHPHTVSLANKLVGELNLTMPYQEPDSEPGDALFVTTHESILGFEEWSCWVGGCLKPSAR
jgi:hypothetical protein